MLHPPSQSFWPSLPLFDTTILYKRSFQDGVGMQLATIDPSDGNVWMVCGLGLMWFEGLEGLHAMRWSASHQENSQKSFSVGEVDGAGVQRRGECFAFSAISAQKKMYEFICIQKWPRSTRLVSSPQAQHCYSCCTSGSHRLAQRGL